MPVIKQHSRCQNCLPFVSVTILSPSCIWLFLCVGKLQQKTQLWVNGFFFFQFCFVNFSPTILERCLYFVPSIYILEHSKLGFWLDATPWVSEILTKSGQRNVWYARMTFVSDPATVWEGGVQEQVVTFSGWWWCGTDRTAAGQVGQVWADDGESRVDGQRTSK